MTEWAKIEAPWADIDNFIDILIDKVDFLDILDECDLEYWECQGDSTHRMKCPLPVHDFGGERTASMFIDAESNKFYCFGCNSGGTVISFVELYYGIPFHESMKLLSKYINIEDCDGSSLPKRKRKGTEDLVETHVFRSSVMIREHVSKFKNTKEYNKWDVWANKQFRKLDSYLDLGDDASDTAKNYCAKLKKYLGEK